MNATSFAALYLLLPFLALWLAPSVVAMVDSTLALYRSVRASSLTLEQALMRTHLHTYTLACAHMVARVNTYLLSTRLHTYSVRIADVYPKLYVAACHTMLCVTP